MNKYKVDVKFTDCNTVFLVWRMKAECVEVLIGNVCQRLRTWMGANGLYLKRLDVRTYDMMLVTICLGTVSIEVDTQGEDDS